jgi:hypothetical protein
MSVRKSPEAQIQRAVIQHLKARAVPGLVYFHVPNGGSRGKIEAAKFKAMGVRPGVYEPQRSMRIRLALAEAGKA